MNQFSSYWCGLRLRAACFGAVINGEVLWLPKEEKSEMERTVPVDEWHRRVVRLSWKTTSDSCSLRELSCLDVPGLEAGESNEDFLEVRLKNERKLPVTWRLRRAVGVLAAELYSRLTLNSGFAKNECSKMKENHTWQQESFLHKSLRQSSSGSFGHSSCMKIGSNRAAFWSIG